MKGEIARYLICGSLAAIFALAVRILFSTVMPFSAATACAQIAAMVFGYFLYRYVVWRKTTRPVASTIVPFVAVNMASLVIVLVVSVAVRAILGWVFGLSEIVSTFAHATGIACGAALSMVGHRTYTFR